jgi:hypothetical protein
MMLDGHEVNETSIVSMYVLVRANNGKAAHPVKLYSELLCIRDHILTRYGD